MVVSGLPQPYKAHATWYVVGIGGTLDVGELSDDRTVNIIVHMWTTYMEHMEFGGLP